MTSSRLSRSHSPSSPDPSFSIDTVGAPMPPQDMISAVVGQVVQVDEVDGPALAHRVRAGEHADVGVASAAGAQHRAPACQGRESVDVDPHRGIVSHVRRRPIG